MDDPAGPTVSRRPSRMAEGVLTLWRGCYDDARLIETPWGDGDAHTLALVHALDFASGNTSRRQRRHQRAARARHSEDDASDDERAGKRGDRNGDRSADDDQGASDGDDDDDGDQQGATLNGLAVRSPLAAATGTYTAERVDDGGRRPWVHLYRACVPDLPGANGRRSSAQVYVKALEAAGLDVAASASLFTGLAWSVGRGVHAQVRVVTHQNVGLDPIEFARRTLVALGAAERAVRRRTAKVVAAADAVTDAVHHEIDRLRDRLLTAYERAPPRQAVAAAAPRHHGPSNKHRRQRRHRRSTYDDGTERVWCDTHERWERVEASCVDASTTSTASRESTTGDLSTTTMMTSSSAACSSAAAPTMTTTTMASASTLSGARSETTQGHGDRTRDAATALLPVAFEIPERSDDAYSCCSECCSSSGCSCSMETSARDTSTTGID